MIINLSVWFGIRTLFHDVTPVQLGQLEFDMPTVSSFDLWAFVLFICATIAVLRYKVGPATTLIVSSAVGIALVWFGLAG